MPEMVTKQKWPLLLCLWFVVLYLLPLGHRPLVIPDEVRYAEIPREMLVSGDWVVPRLNSVHYFEKPVMGYWAVAASLALFGLNNWAVRFPFALAAGLSALLLYALIRRFSDRSDSAGWACLIYLTCLEVYALGTYAVLDGLLAFFLTAALAAFYWAYRQSATSRRQLGLALFGAMCSLAFLTKGFLAFAVPVAVIVPFMIWEGRWRALFSWFWLPIVVALLVALPWSVLIHLREADFWRYFFWEEHIRRFLADDAQHIEPFWFYLPVVLLGVLPWSFQLPAAIRGYRHAPLRDSWQRFVLLWTLMPLLFFSISKGKLVTYIIPCFAPLAVWLADGLARYLSAKHHKAFDRGALAACGLCVLFTLVLLGAWFLPAPWQVFQSTEWAKWLGAVGLFLLAAGCAYQAWRLETGERKMMAFALSGFVIMAGFTYVIPHKALATKTPHHFLAAMQSEIGPDDILISDDNMFHAVCWYYQRADVYLLMRMGELKYGMHRPDGRRQFLSRDDFKKLLAAEGGQGRLVLIYKYRGQYDDLPAEPLFEAREGMFVFRKY